MSRLTLEALLEGDPATGWRVRAPAVGVWSRIPAPGSNIDECGPGVLTQVGRRFVLTLPAEASGRVTDGPTEDRKELKVEWGQELFRIAGRIADSGAACEDAATTKAAAAQDVFLAPSDGVFYARPTPDAKPFAGVGETIARGQPVGLIEVMKTFNHVLFEGEGLPASAVVAEILVADGTEVRVGDPILRFESHLKS